MSVIQKIRDKYARWAVVAIALSLLGFIMMDAFAGRSGLFGGGSTTVGRVNGKKISIQDFNKKVAMQEQMAKAQGYNLGDESRQQIVESVWNQEIERTLLEEELQKLGLAITDKELKDILYGENPPEDFKRMFSDPNTGVYNPQQAQQSLNELRKRGTPEQKAEMNEFLASLEFQRLVEKYTSLIGNSTYFPKWLLEKQNTDNSLIANVAYVGIPYATISDSAVKVTDKEIQEYINDHKDDFKQEEETRSISYVVFNASATAADSAAVRNQLTELKDDFRTTSDAKAFLARNGSTIDLFDGYISKSQIQVPVKDSIFALPVGGVYGPYIDANNYVLAKLIDVRTLPDSVKARHILIGTANPQTGQPTMPDSVAKAKADSIAAAIAGGASFDQLEEKYSTDEAAGKDKGVMTFSSVQIQSEGFAKEFGDFILFEGKPGSRKVVKTNFGYHYIEVLQHINPQPHYKVAYLSRPIAPSAETDNAANSAANLFAGDSRNLKAFEANFDKNLRNKGYVKSVAADIRENDYTIQGLGNSREFIKAIFEADKGDVLEPKSIGESYVVAVVTDINKAGLVSVSRARSMVEPILRNKKKAAQIKQNLGAISTLEAASAKVGQPIQAVDSLRFNGERNPALGFELKVIGASFNPANNGKVVPEALEGQAGVYVLKVNSQGTTPVGAANIEEQRRMLQMQARQSMMYRSPIQALRKSAKIEDNRSDFF